MTLYDTIRAVEAAAGRQAAIASIVRNDIFRLNALKDVQYGILGWSQGVHDIGEDTLTVRLTLYYIDRLTEGGSNELEVQSTGVEVLGGVLRDLQGQGIVAQGWTAQTFTQRFSDECAGAFAAGRLVVGASTICAETVQDNHVTIY